MLKRIIWMLAPVVISRVMNKRQGQQPRADKRRYNGRSN